MLGRVDAGGGPAVDIALDPLEGTTVCAKNQPNSLAVIAIATKGKIPGGRLPWHRQDKKPMFIGNTKDRYPKPDGTVCQNKGFVGEGVKLDCAGSRRCLA